MPIRAIWFRRSCASYQVGILMYGLVSFSSSLWIEAVLWHGVLFTEDMSLIYACKHAETIKEQYDSQASFFWSSLSPHL